MSDTFDYIIVGSGACGSVLANRLTSDGSSTVCVVEAGPPDTNPYIRVPAAYIKNLNNPDVAWQFYSEPAAGSAGRKIYLPQGKVLGGSTSINGLVYNRGQADDFDRWEELGATGWNYEDVLPYFKRCETRPGGDPAVRGMDGPLEISDIAEGNPICDAFVAAAAALGVPADNDYNSRQQRGAGYYQRFIYRGKRVTAATAYLKPAMSRSNLQVLTHANVTQLKFEGRRATGVVYRHRGTEPNIELNARREVILCAGTVNSTKLLQLSGVGQAARLHELGIKVVHDLAGVGENFQDHYFVRCAARFKSGTQSLNLQARGMSLVREVVKWLMGKPSVLALSPSVAYAFLNSEDITAKPDLQFVFTHGTYKPGKVYELDTFSGATCGFTQQRPRSTGYIRIQSADPLDHPLIQPNYLQHELDQQVVIRAVKLARAILRSEHFQPMFESEAVPGDQVRSDDELLDFARSTGNTGYHLVGTNTMGQANNPASVVSPELKVHGIDRLRVIDASVMPRVTSSNTCAAAYMIAEKGADLILAGR